MSTDIHVWMETFLKPWPDLVSQWTSLKVVLLPCSDDGWDFVKRLRGRGPSIRLWLRVWIRRRLWLNFCTLWHGGYPFFFFYILSWTLFLYFIFTFTFIFYLQNLWRQKNTFCVEPTFFFRHFYFRCLLVKKKNPPKNPYHTFTTRASHVWLSGDAIVQWIYFTLNVQSGTKFSPW